MGAVPAAQSLHGSGSWQNVPKGEQERGSRQRWTAGIRNRCAVKDVPGGRVGQERLQAHSVNIPRQKNWIDCNDHGLKLFIPDNTRSEVLQLVPTGSQRIRRLISW